MRIICVGAGPTELYFVILTKLRDPAAHVTVLETCRRLTVSCRHTVTRQNVPAALKAYQRERVASVGGQPADRAL